MTRDDLYHHYRRYYAPNNAQLAMAGDFEAEDMLDRLTELYGEIPPAPPMERYASGASPNRP